MKKNKLSKIWQVIAACIILVNTAAVSGQEISQMEIDSYFKNLPFDMAPVQIPVFPQKFFLIDKYGAKGDGLTKNTEFIQKAIDECSASGGGYVVVPAGLWVTGPIELRNDVNFHLEKGAMIVFSADHNDYKFVKAPGKNSYVNSPQFLGFELNHIAITGEGLINGNGQSWRPVKKMKATESQWKAFLKSGGGLNNAGDEWWPSAQAASAENFLSQYSMKDLKFEDFNKIKDYYRPSLLLLVSCKNILLDGPSFQNSAAFSCNISKCRDIIIRDVKVNNEWWAQNADGIDLTSCVNAIICKCTVNTGDDGICMKSSRYDKKNSEAELRNIVIADCLVYHAHGGFVVGSNTDGGVKNVSVRNCNFAWTDTGLRFKSGIGKGGLVEDIYIENIYMKDIETDAVIFDLQYVDTGAPKTKDQIAAEKMPSFRKIKMNHIICERANQAVNIKDIPEKVVKDIEINDATFITEKGISLLGGENINFNDIRLKTKNSPIITINGSRGIQFNSVSCLEPVDLYIKISGESSTDILLANSNTDCSKKEIEFSSGATPAAFKKK